MKAVCCARAFRPLAKQLMDSVMNAVERLLLSPAVDDMALMNIHMLFAMDLTAVVEQLNQDLC